MVINSTEQVNQINRIKELVEKLNSCRDAYYNHNTSNVSDKWYDDLFDELKSLEEETEFILPNSPTQTVGYTVQSKLNKVTHSHKMLSLDKTKDLNDIVKYFKNHDIVGMLKMDGLTCSLSYDAGGNLIKAETRGNGEVGEDILENAKVVSNIPKHIDSRFCPLTVDGEIIIDYDSFNKVNSTLETKYSHPRNLASGSIRQLDTKITAERNLKFVAWKLIDSTEMNSSFSTQLWGLDRLGFDVVPYELIRTEELDIFNLANYESKLKEAAEKNRYPIDGLVFSFNDVKYGNSLGDTAHHVLSQMAYKFYDSEYETILRDVEWNTTRTGMLAPTAIFDAIDLDGAITTRATLHNVTYMKDLELGIGDTIVVYRANAVIPKIKDNLTRSNTYKYPEVCPCCGSKLDLTNDNGTEFLYCRNALCSTKLLNRFVHFVSKSCVDIKGLSEATLEKLLMFNSIKTYKDLYHLFDNVVSFDKFYLDGFGEKSAHNLFVAIEKSREVTLDRLINAMEIPQIGATASKTLSKVFDGDVDKFLEALRGGYDFSQLPDFGPAAQKALADFGYQARNNFKDTILEGLIPELKIVKEEVVLKQSNNFISGKVFVVTGSFNRMSRSNLEKLISEHGGKLASGVSSSTDFLLNNDVNSPSNKNKKARELGIPIMSEEEFFEKAGV